MTKKNKKGLFLVVVVLAGFILGGFYVLHSGNSSATKVSPKVPKSTINAANDYLGQLDDSIKAGDFGNRKWKPGLEVGLDDDKKPVFKVELPYDSKNTDVSKDEQVKSFKKLDSIMIDTYNSNTEGDDIPEYPAFVIVDKNNHVLASQKGNADSLDIKI